MGMGVVVCPQWLRRKLRCSQVVEDCCFAPASIFSCFTACGWEMKLLKIEVFFEDQISQFGQVFLWHWRKAWLCLQDEGTVFAHGCSSVVFTQTFLGERYRMTINSLIKVPACGSVLGCWLFPHSWTPSPSGFMKNHR